MRKENTHEIYNYYLRKILSDIGTEEALFSRLENYISCPTRQHFYYWLNRAKEYYNKLDLNCIEFICYLVVVEKWVLINTKETKQ